MRTSFALLALVLVLSLATGKTLARSNPSIGTAATPANTGASAAEAPVPPQSPVEAPDGPLTIRVTRRSDFAWPALGPITSYFGPGHPLGVDIGLSPGEDSPIFASAAGAVYFAGGNACCDYGYHVIIDHDNGMSTLYGHFSKLLVETGQHVEQGEVLGFGGATGEADGKHLHFEVHDTEDRVVDPFRYLPARQELRYGTTTQNAGCPSEPISVDASSMLAIDFLPRDGEQYTLQSLSLDSGGAGGSFGDIEDVEDRPLGVTYAVPPAAAATGAGVRLRLDAGLSHGDSPETITCELVLRTMATLANSPQTIAAYRSRFLTATPTPMPTRVKATPTRTKTPVPPTSTKTAPRSATATAPPAPYRTDPRPSPTSPPATPTRRAAGR